MPMPQYINLNRARDNQKFALEMFTKHGIVACRMTKDGQIAWIKHATFGWLSAAQYLLLQKLKELPWAAIVEGGYRLNAEIYGAEVSAEVLATGAKVPLGLILVGLTAGTILLAIERGELQQAAILLAALALPFGSLYLLYFFADAIGKWLGQTGEALVGLGSQYLVGPLFGIPGAPSFADLLTPGLTPGV